MIMNKAKARDPLSQRILDLTLEMIFLLTGEDHMVVKIQEMVTDNSSCQISNGHLRTQSLNTEPPPHSGIHGQNNEKILELTNKIIRLLTEEVPIRCEDVTVHLTMEEWEYLEEHKDLYKDVVMEKHQPIIVFDKTVSEFHTPVSYSDFGTGNKISNEETYLNKTTKGRAESATYTERESLAPEERHVSEKDLYPITEYSATDIKEEPASYEALNLTDRAFSASLYMTPTDYTSTYIGAEPDSHGGDLLHSDIYPLTENTQSEDPSTDTKKESPTYEGDLTGTDLYKQVEHAQTEWSPDNSGEYLKGKTNLEINPSKSLIESRKPDQSIYYTDLVTPKSVYKDHSALSTEMGKVSYSEPDLDVEDINYREEPLSFISCGENSTSTSALTYQQLHIEGQPFSCPECGKYFIDRIALKTHQRNHTQEKAFNCPECGKCFARASNLAAHKMIHTGEKTFKCPECGKDFTQSSSLSRHKKIHTGEKPFKCTVCGKCFAQASHLATHTTIHTGEKPFKCSECGKCFIVASDLTKHKRIHTGEKPFKCHDCGKCFTLGSHLKSHKRTHRRKNIEMP